MCHFLSDSCTCFDIDQEMEFHVLLCEAFSLMQTLWASIGPGSQPLCLLLILFIMASCASFRLHSLFSLHSLFKEMPRTRERHLLKQTGRHYKRRREVKEHVFIFPGPPKQRVACSLLEGVRSFVTFLCSCRISHSWKIFVPKEVRAQMDILDLIRLQEDYFAISFNVYHDTYNINHRSYQLMKINVKNE